MKLDVSKVGVVGASGYLGSLLSDHLELKGYEVVRISRVVRGASWRVFEKGCLEGLDAIFNFAGTPIDCRWTDAVKEELLQSRVEPAKKIAEWIAEMPEDERPTVSLSCSGVGYYGDRGDEVISESSTKGDGYIADLCAQWERAADYESLGVRCVALRLGAVLGKESKAWVKMSLPYKMFVGGAIGSGKSYFSWIHEADALGAMMYCLENAKMAGEVNLCAESITHSCLAKSIGESMRRPSIMKVPVFVMNLLLGEFAGALLASLNTRPKVLLGAGYQFNYLKIEDALDELVG